jgi:hypothetical protein
LGMSREGGENNGKRAKCEWIPFHDFDEGSLGLYLA